MLESLLSPSILMVEYSARPSKRLDIFIDDFSLPPWSEITKSPNHGSVVLASFTKPSKGW
jgi:hypothetical protein